MTAEDERLPGNLSRIIADATAGSLAAAPPDTGTPLIPAADPDPDDTSPAEPDDDRPAVNRGNAGKGRPRGSLNKTTQAAKETILHANELLGGARALVEWAGKSEENRTLFYTKILVRTLPYAGTEAPAPGQPMVFVWQK